MVEKPYRVNISPINGFYQGETISRDPVYAIYYNDAGVLFALCMKRFVKDRLNPWYVAVDYNTRRGDFEGGIYGFTTIDGAHNAMVQEFGELHTLFNFKDFKKINVSLERIERRDHEAQGDYPEYYSHN